MAQTREAAVRLTLAAGQFTASMRQLADNLNRQWERVGRAMQTHVTAGLKGAKSSLSELGGAAKKAGGLVTGLAASFSMAGALKHTLELDTRLQTLAYRVKLATGELETATSLQQLFERTAAKTGRTVGDMADAFEGVFAATRDLQYSKDTLEAVANTASATGESIGTVATLAHQMQRKFQMSADQVGDALAQIAQGAVQGGPSVAEFAATFDQLGAVMLQNGMRGKQALGFIIGALNATDSEGAALGQRVSGLQAMMTKLGSPMVLEALAKSLQIPASSLLNEKDFQGRLGAILKHGEKGIAALKRVFVEASEASMARILFFDPFKDALARAQSSGLKGRDAAEGAIRALEAQIADFGKATVTAADLQEQGARMMQTPAARLTKALDDLNTAVAQPEVVDAMSDLSKVMPELAGGFGKLLRMIIQNPVLAGAIGIGGYAAKGFLLEMGKSIVASHIAGAQAFVTRFAAANSLAAAQIATGLKAGAVAAAAIFAYQKGKEAIDESFGNAADAQSRASAASAAAAGGGSVAQQRKQADDLAAAIEGLRQSQGGVDGFIQDTAGGLASVFGVEAPNLRGMTDARIEELERQLADKRAKIADMAKREADAKAQPAGAPATAAPAPPAAVKLDAAAPRAIGLAVSSALGVGRGPLRVEVVNLGGRSGGSGNGRRGPMGVPPAASGGGY